MDHFYRLFHAAFGKGLKTSNTAIDDLFKKVRDTQTENIIKAGEIVAESVANGGCIFLSSICHHMEMDSIYRGGGPIFYRHFSSDLQIENGWTYFIHGWTQVIAEVFHVDITGERLAMCDRLAR